MKNKVWEGLRCLSAVKDRLEISCWLVFIHKWKLQEKRAFVYTAFLYTPDDVLLCKAMLVGYQLVISFMLWINKTSYRFAASWFEVSCFIILLVNVTLKVTKHIFGGILRLSTSVEKKFKHYDKH